MNKPNLTRILTVVMTLALITSVMGQKSAVKPNDEIEQLKKKREKALVQNVYAQTQSAKSASDYTKLIEDCQNAIENQQLNAKNKAYLSSLISWSMNRRGYARLDLSNQLREINNYDQADELLQLARTDFSSASELNPEAWRPQVGLGCCMAESGEYLSAVEKFAEIEKAFPGQTSALFNRGELWFAMDKFETALESYDAAIKANPSDLQAITGRAHCLSKLGQHTEALKEYNVVAQLQPTSAWALINAADCNQTLGNWQAAYDQYLNAMKIQQLAPGYQKVGWMLATCPDAQFLRGEMALSLANKAIELGGESSLSLETLAAAQAATSDFEAAQTSLKHAITLSGNQSEKLEKRLELYTAGRLYLQGQSEQSVAELPSTIRE